MKAIPTPLEHTPWVDMTDGIEMRLLRVFADGAGYAAVFRFAPGMQLPKHHHMGCVHAYTLKGSWRYLEYDWVARPGSYVFEEPGSVHTLQVEDGPVEIMFVAEGGMVLVDDDGNPQLIWDTRMMAELYESRRQELAS